MKTNQAAGARPAKSHSGYDLRPLTQATRERLAKDFTAEERRVLLSQGTEPPFCGGLLDNKREGIYACRLCGLPLFSSKAKFNSGTGWPSFSAPIDPAHVRDLEDRSHGMRRVENRCARCDAHLGHVFDDGPPPTGLRYCMNSVSLQFFDAGLEPPQHLEPVAA